MVKRRQDSQGIGGELRHEVLMGWSGRDGFPIKITGLVEEVGGLCTAVES